VGLFALVLAVVAVTTAALPFPGMFVAMGAGIAAAGTGLVAWRRVSAPGPARLAGAAGMGLAGLALVVAGVRSAVTLAAVGRLTALISGS